MCLYIDDQATAKIRKRLQKYGKIKVWKVLRKNFASMIYNKKKSKWIAGVNKSNRKSKRLTKEEQREKIVLKGIHVYLQKPKDPINFEGDITIPLYGYQRDFIAADRHEAVFMKVTLLKKDIEKAEKLITQ